MNGNMNDKFISLVSDIYDAAFEPSLWSDVLVRLTDAVGGTQVMMGIHDFSPRSIRVIAPRMDPGHMRSYVNHWGAFDLLWQRTNREPVGKLLIAECFLPRDELLDTDFYHEWHQAMGLGASGIGVNLFVESGVPAVCGIKRAVDADAFSHHELELFGAIAPHLIRASKIHHRVCELEIRESLVEAAVDHRKHGVIVVDRHGYIVFINEIAGALFEQSAGLALESGRISSTDVRAGLALYRSIQNCTTPGNNKYIQGASLTVRRDGRPPLNVLVTPFPKRLRETPFTWQIPGTPSAIILITDPERERHARKDLLRSRYQLTSAEAELALEILNGDGRELAAARLGISPGTARIQLQRIFDKVGVHRQAKLVRTLADAFKAY